jgi:tyrosyl-tRNA synthetase
MILQAYDFVELNKRYDCRVQFGGSDQWGNIVMGTELNRKVENVSSLLSNEIDEAIQFEKEVSGLLPSARNDGETELFGLTTPLLTTASGAKMGKTADGAVWLNSDMFSPYEYWQFWRNVDDADVKRFLKLFTTIDMSDIERLPFHSGEEINNAKKRLATEVTALLHGREAAERSEETARQTFEQGITSASLPEVELKLKDEDYLPAYALFARAGLASSNKEARRLIQGGGAKVNDEKVADENQQFAANELRQQCPLKLSAGKKKHILLKVV